jgi:pimeloyl-ACP methyl ester carboxylesterase
MKVDSNISAPTKFVQLGDERYAYRRFGNGSGVPLLFLQHFTGTLDNWDPAVTDPLAIGREVILFESAGVGRSTGDVPKTVAGMATHALGFSTANHHLALQVPKYAKSTDDFSGGFPFLASEMRRKTSLTNSSLSTGLVRYA